MLTRIMYKWIFKPNVGSYDKIYNYRFKFSTQSSNLLYVKIISFPVFISAEENAIHVH
jgi:hypothetical protein